jgi:hypothetical protein
MMLLTITTAVAIPREDVLDNAAAFATHIWTMTAVNEAASCSTDYTSDFTAGTWVGLPYDWGGWVTLDEFDGYIDDGYGAGSHSWHGTLWCTTGVDCSGFVSQTWETDQKYGTATFYQVTEEITTSALMRGDALNKPGSHIVLFTHETASGLPVHYESIGDGVWLDSSDGWSTFSSYVPIRYEDIEDGPSTGTTAEPIEITSFPYTDHRWTAGAASDVIDAYDCAPEIDESGPEMLYRFSVSSEGVLHATVSDGSDIDIDLHVLTATDGTGCLARDDSEVELTLPPGVYWLSLDTYVGSREFPGPYLLSATFSGELGEVPGEGDSGLGLDSETTEPGASPSVDQPGSVVSIRELGGCSHAPGRDGLKLALIILIGTLISRSPGRFSKAPTTED